MVVRFTPIGAHLFLGVPLHSIANDAVDIELIDRSLARMLMSRVAVAKSWSERFDLVEALIAERVGERSIPLSIGLAWRKLAASDGRITLASLAGEMDCSHRALIARFRTYIGFPPKTIARLMRFNLAVRTLDGLRNARADDLGKPYIEGLRGEDSLVHAIQWADIAADCGYFDQAHFIHEFREFAGDSPAAFLRNVSSLR